MKCLFLGTGNALNTARRHNTSLFLTSENSSLMIDCNGATVQRLDAAGYNIDDIAHIFLTHAHIDHINGLIGLFQQIWLKTCFGKENPRTTPLNIYGNELTIKIVRNLFAAVRMEDHQQIFPIIYHEHPIDEAGQIDCGDIGCEFFPVEHMALPCFGLRVQGQERALVYSADTTPCAAVRERYTPDDILVHECNHFEDPSSPVHTTWPQIEVMLGERPAHHTYLVHLPPLSETDEAALQPRIEEVSSKVSLARDGQAFTF